jgi:cytochrome c556
MLKSITIALSLTAVTLAGAVWAGGHGGNPAVKARKAHMQLYAFNLGTLGGMAKGEIEYNAEAAQAAANNMAALSAINQGPYWAAGTSMDDLGEETEALAAIWAEGSTAGDIGRELVEASNALAAVAGDGQEALGGALGAVGKTCGTCHKAYRKP